MLVPLVPSSAGRLSIAGMLVLAGTLPSQAAQNTPRIAHQGIGCIVAGRHAVVEALVEPAGELVSVKVYFRADVYPAFFFVEAAPVGDRYQAVLPRPTRDVSGVVYYLEAVDRAFSSFRTEEFRPRVVLAESDCEEDEPRPAYVEGPGEIIVGGTEAGSSFPPGFLTEGIVGAIAAGRAGASTAVLGVGAAVGAAAGVGVLVTGGSDANTTTIPIGSGVTTTAPVATSTLPTTSIPSSSGSVVACFDTSPNPPTIPIGETVRFDASCSQPRDQIATYAWDFNDGREGRDGRVVTRQYASPGVFPVVLVVTDGSGTQARTEKEVRVNQASGGPGGPAPGPGPTTTVPGTADLSVTGLSSPAPRRNIEVNYTVNYRNAGPDLDPTVTVVISLNAAGAGGAPIPVSTPGCGTSSGAGSLTASCFIGPMAAGATGSTRIRVKFPTSDIYSVTATIFGGASDPNSGNDSRTVSTRVTLKTDEALETSFVSEIQSEAQGEVRASIELNGLSISATSAVRGFGPSRQRMTPRPGTNLVALHAASRDLEGALWKIDFTQTEGFVLGSIRVDSGEVMSSSAQVVVFRLAGSETRIRFRFEVEE